MMRVYKIIRFMKTALTGFSIAVALSNAFSIEPANEEEEEISRKLRVIETIDFGDNKNVLGIKSALRIYYDQKGCYPASLDDLVIYNACKEIEFKELYDAFNMHYAGQGAEKEAKYEKFRYERKELNECYVWSIGPDGIDDNHSRTYSRENGWKSKGDIILHLKKNELVPINSNKDENSN